MEEGGVGGMKLMSCGYITIAVGWFIGTVDDFCAILPRYVN